MPLAWQSSSSLASSSWSSPLHLDDGAQRDPDRSVGCAVDFYPDGEGSLTIDIRTKHTPTRATVHGGPILVRLGSRRAFDRGVNIEHVDAPLAHSFLEVARCDEPTCCDGFLGTSKCNRRRFRTRHALVILDYIGAGCQGRRPEKRASWSIPRGSRWLSKRRPTLNPDR